MAEHDSFPSDKGTYILMLWLDNPARLTIGRLGESGFSAGWYAYTGSAFGSGGLRGRLKHHLAPVRKAHWHIDYLRSAAPVQEVWYLASQNLYEHDWATILSVMPGAVIPVARFGASDCRCSSHLMHFPQIPDFNLFTSMAAVSLGRWTSDQRYC